MYGYRRSGVTGSFGVPAPLDSKHPAPTIATLDGYALERWEVGVAPVSCFIFSPGKSIRLCFTTWSLLVLANFPRNPRRECYIC